MGRPVVHFEIVGRDPARLRSYYSELFGWEFQVGDAATEWSPIQVTTASWTAAPLTAGSTAVSAAGRALRGVSCSTWAFPMSRPR